MRAEYDFTKARRNPYARRLKRQITIRIDPHALDYFRRLSKRTGVRYQTLINLYLCDCAEAKRTLSMRWKDAS